MKTPVVAKGWLTSKTNIVALFIIFSGTLQQLRDAAVLPEQYQGWLVTACGVAMFAMRFLTTQPVASSPVQDQIKYVESAAPAPLGQPVGK